MILLRWLTFLPRSDCDPHSPGPVDLFISSDTSICSTMVFPPLRNSDHGVVSVSIDFPSYSQQDAPFHHTAYDYSRADWDSLRDDLRDVPWEDIFKSGLDCILVMVLKNCEPELSYILAELFNKCLKECCFPGRWKVSLAPVVKNVWGRSTAKNYHPVSLFFVVSKVFEKLVNNRIFDHPCGLFSDFQYDFRSS